MIPAQWVSWCWATPFWSTQTHTTSTDAWSPAAAVPGALKSDRVSLLSFGLTVTGDVPERAPIAQVAVHGETVAVGVRTDAGKRAASISSRWPRTEVVLTPTVALAG